MTTSTSAIQARESSTSRAHSPTGTLLLRGPSPNQATTPLSSPTPEFKVKLHPVVNTIAKHDSSLPNHNTPTSKLITHTHLPTYLLDNLYIYTHYRRPIPSVLHCLTSWTYLHNETVNIFTHLLPCLVILSLIYHLCVNIFPDFYPLASVGDKVVLGVFLAAAIVCFGVSAGFHTLLCHSEKVAGLWLQFDFLGIVAMIEGCFVSGIYVTFYCEPGVMHIYWGMILALGLLCALVVCAPQIQGPKYRALRLAAFIAMGLSAIAPIAHGLYMFGVGKMIVQSGLPYYLVEGVLVGLGAWVYNMRFPEVVYPGRFDVWGHSHQVFHVLVLCAMGVHFVGIERAYAYIYLHRWCVEAG